MADGGDVDQVGVLRVDDHGADLPHVPEPDEAPALPGVGRLVDAAPRDHVAADAVRAGADVDDVRVGVGDIDGADRSGTEVAVGDVVPGRAVIGRLPDAAARGAHVEGTGLLRDSRHRRDPAAARRADHPIAQVLE